MITVNNKNPYDTYHGWNRRFHRWC